MTERNHGDRRGHKTLAKAVGGLPLPPKLGRPPMPRVNKPAPASPQRPAAAKPPAPKASKPVPSAAGRRSVAGRLGSFGSGKRR